jgi:O-antigen/teichoic acid export membrane protein
MLTYKLSQAIEKVKETLSKCTLGLLFSKNSTHARTLNYYIQIKRSVVIKLLVTLCSFISVPIMIAYLGKVQYGVWSTLLTIISWVTFFDLGIGNGLRNKIAESVALKKLSAAKIFISTCYSWVGVGCSVIFIILLPIFIYLPWQSIFNTTEIKNNILCASAVTVLSFVLFNFWLGLVNQVFGALQKSWLVSFSGLLSSAVSLIAVSVLAKTTSASIIYIAMTYGVSMTAGTVLLNVLLVKKFPELAPTLNFDKQKFVPLLKTGLQFFGIQLAYIILYTTDKVIITNIFGPASVTSYDIVFKLFGSIIMIQGIITGPLWSAYTEAYLKSDYNWIRQTIKNQIIIFLFFAVATTILGFLSKPIISFWIGKDIEIPPYLIECAVIYTLVVLWLNIFAMFLNGVQKIKIQLYISLVGAILNIPVSILLAKYTDYGSAAVVFGTILVLLPVIIIVPYQSALIIKKKDKGIWAM